MIGVRLNTNIQKRRDADVNTMTLRGVKRRRPNTMVYGVRALARKVEGKETRLRLGVYQVTVPRMTRMRLYVEMASVAE